MAQVIQFKPKLKMDLHVEGKSYNREDLSTFDYKSTWQVLKQNRPDVLPKAATHTVKPLELAQGAMIALHLKGDQQSADALSIEFSKAIQCGQLQVPLSSLPEFARGYVWGYNVHILYRARAEVEHYNLATRQRK